MGSEKQMIFFRITHFSPKSNMEKYLCHGIRMETGQTVANRVKAEVMICFG